ncbi:hypothetical protein ACJX0J_039595, partial [Zea mays]
MLIQMFYSILCIISKKIIIFSNYQINLQISYLNDIMKTYDNLNTHSIAIIFKFGMYLIFRKCTTEKKHNNLS